MKSEEVVSLIQSAIPEAKVLIEGEDCSFSVTVISDSFAGMSPLKKQQAVLGSVKEQLRTGALHAMSVKALTPDEWKSQLVSL